MHANYRRGMCVDCGENPYRFGRVRCPKCHDVWESLRYDVPNGESRQAPT
jgi:hypothetical protein